MKKVHWKSTGGGAFEKVVRNMNRVMGTDSSCRIIATCSGNPRRLNEYTEGKKVWFAAVNYDQLRREVIEELKHVDLIVGISIFCAKTIQKYVPNVRAGHLGVDTKIYYPAPLKSSAKFRFLTTACNESYGRSIMEKAWKLAVDKMPFAELIVKDHDGMLREGIERFEALPRCKVIEPTGWHLSETGLCKLYNSAECLVYPVPSIGSSLTALESMACGVPVIAPNYSALPEIVDNDCGWLIDVDEEEAVVEGNYQVCPKRGMAKVDQLAEAMLDAYNNVDKTRRRGGQAWDRIRNSYTWEHAAERFSTIVEGNL